MARTTITIPDRDLFDFVQVLQSAIPPQYDMLELERENDSESLYGNLLTAAMIAGVLGQVAEELIRNNHANG